LFVVAAATIVMAAAAAPVTASGVLLPVYFALGLTLYVGLLVAMGEIRATHLAAVWDGLGLRTLTRDG
jgi:hypothetical protein